METSPDSGLASSLEGHLQRIDSLVHEIVRHAGFQLSFVVKKSSAMGEEFETPEYVVDFSGPDADLLLEKNATLLNALEHVVLKAVRLEEELFGKISFDCQDCRRLRAAELQLTAQVAADRVAETGDPFTLSPMSPRERRIIHLALKDRPEVRTLSEGVGSERKVVILPASSSRRKR
jgi:spoIIIJ-associated protein